MDNKNINDFKKQYTFCISLLSQLIEEIESELNTSFIKNNKHRRILFSIYSMLKFQVKLFQDLFALQNKQLYNITQFQETRNIFDAGKAFFKKTIKEILSFSKTPKEVNQSKNAINNCFNTSNFTNNTINNIMENINKNLINEKLKDTNNNDNNYNDNNDKSNISISKNERKLAKDNSSTYSKSIEILNGNNNINSISSFHRFKQNKLMKNVCNIKKCQSKTYKNVKNKSKLKKDFSNHDYKQYITNTTESKNNDTNDFNKSNTKSTISINTNQLSHQKIVVNQINSQIQPKTNKNINTNIKRNIIISNQLPQHRYMEENPVRKVKNIIINAKSLSSLNIGFINQYLCPNKRSAKDILKNSNSTNSISKDKSNKKNIPYYEVCNENKTYAVPFYAKKQNEQKINVRKEKSKDRKCNEILIDGMKNIKMKLNSIENNQKIKKAKSINDLSYIKAVLNNKNN